MTQPTDYTLIRSDRKTVALQIEPSGRLIVRAPRRMPLAVISAFIRAHANWIEAHRLLMRQRAAQAPALTAEELRALSRQAADALPRRVAHFAPLVGVDYGRITIRCQKTRWGSCSGKGNLNFNCLLMLCPPAVVDYVVVHELCHRKQMNHSPRFWAEVARVLPAYPAARQWLKKEGQAIMARHRED